MKQKINLIRGLLADSEVLLIDGPETHLDCYTKFNIQNDIYRIWKEYHKTIVCITHDVEEALKLANFIWVFSKPPVKIIKKFDVISCKINNPQNSDAQLQILRNQILQVIRDEALSKAI